ncbi:hypothetical protein CD29_11080 [Ureibacillus manganicus DSM 26584]|uniref:Uncharacterized protein n=1 Tax=Ureibacillus manganicus DSM 26584 TaxID=1384049 RepID=A0A0A3I167_9BACL|nr:hypothetical protein CD29_11080 [Ureibacillus manganicus DSM 26584]
MRQLRKNVSKRCLVEALYVTNEEKTEHEMSRRSVKHPMRQMRKDPSEKCPVEAFYETNTEEPKQEMSRRSIL